MSKKIILAVVLLLGSGFAATGCIQAGQRAREQKPAPSPTRQSVQSPLPPPSGHVNDYVPAIDDGTHDRLEQALVELQKRSNINLVVAIVKSTGDQPIFDYSLAVARGWDVSTGRDGILLLVATDDRRWRIQTSRGLERDLPDQKVKDLGDLMNGPFSQQHYGEGISRCIEAMIKVLAEKRGFAPIKIPVPLLPG